MRHRYPEPGNKDELEDFCVRFYRHLLKRSGLVRYGKSGEKQDGIDIIDQLGMKPLIAIQCKCHEPAKTLPPREIKKEVSLAESSPHPIDRYIITTTARKTRNAQDTVLKLNQTKPDSRRFTVEVYFWEDICADLDVFGKAIAEFIVFGESSTEASDESLPTAIGGKASVTTDSASDTEGMSLFPDIDELFKRRKLEVAEHEILKLPDPEQDKSLGTRQRYAILRLRAKLALEHLHFDEAVRLFNLAYDTCPELEQAQQNRVLALEFSGDHRQAFAAAAQLLSEGVQTPFLVTLLIRNASENSDLLPHQATIDKFTSTDEDVNLALAGNYLNWNQIPLAKDAARKALEIAPESAHALFSFGMISHHTGVQGDWQFRTENLEEANRFYSAAIVAAEQNKFIGLLPEIYTNRGRVRAVLGKRDEAGNDFRSAVRISDKPSLYAETAASFFLHEQDFDAARELLSVLDCESDEGTYLAAVTQYHHAPHDEKRHQITAFIKLADRDFDRATEVRFQSVQWAIDLNDLELAHQCVPEAFVSRLPFQGNTLLAWIAFERGDKELAHDLAANALESSSRTAHRQEIAVLATLLLRIGDDEKSLPLLEHIATPGVLDTETKRLVDCARRLDRHDILLRVCEELRQTHQHDNLIRKLEVQLLSNYQPEQAFLLATQYRQFERTYFTAARNYLAVQLGRKAEIVFDDTPPPRPDEFAPEEAYLILTPYIETGRYFAALVFAYQQLREHFAVERAHGQYIWLVLKYGTKAKIPHPPAVVDQQSAIRLENLITGEQRWLVFEDDRPDPARNEVSSSTPVGQALIGKRIDDLVDLRGPAVQMQQERIIEVQSKYTRLFQDAMSNFQHRFPGAGTIQSIHMGSGETFDPTPLIESLKGRRNYVDEVMAFYRDNVCSLHLLAEKLGRNERQLIIGLTSHEDSFIRCVECAPPEFSAKVQAGFDATRIVLDVSAIVTISRLKAWDYLDPDLEYYVSRSTSNMIGEWLHELADQDGQPSAHSSLADDGEIVIEDISPKHMEDERDEVRAIVAKVNEFCSVKDSIAIASLDPKRRKQYLDVCGLHSLESFCIAKDEGALLWTDDLFVAWIGELDFGIGRTWTQLVLKTAENSGRLDGNIYSEMTARLLAWNYYSTIWHAQDVIAAGNLCEWNANAWPLKQCVRWIGKCPLRLRDKAQFAMEFLRLLRRSDCIPLKQTPVIQAVLDAIGNTNAVKSMLQRLDQFFQIDFPSAEFLKAELLYWLRLR